MGDRPRGLGKLDQIDIRLRQLEEKQQLHLQLLPESYFPADLRHQNQCRSLSSALHEVHLKGTLMERLHFLETRIRQLSCELDKGSDVGTSASQPTNGINGWLQPITRENQDDMALYSTCVVGGPSRSGEVIHRGTRQIQIQKPQMKAVKDSKEVLGAMEKRATAMCRDEKRRMERTRIYRKWFPVGC